MKLINKALLDSTSEKARDNERLRMNYNFHESMEEGVHRLLNALEVGTYIPPHRHLNPKRTESFVLLRGKLAVFIFDDLGNIEDKIILDISNESFGVDIPAGKWHSLLILETNTVIYEVKEGPYSPIDANDIAPWAPNVMDENSVKKYLSFLQNSLTTE